MEIRDESEPAADSGPRVEQKADLGILFVHGIGNQKPGDTLAAFGEPLVGWIKSWLGSVERTWVEKGLTAEDVFELKGLKEWQGKSLADQPAWVREAIVSLALRLPRKQGGGANLPLEEWSRELNCSAITGGAFFRAAELMPRAEEEHPRHAHLDLYYLKADGTPVTSNWLLAEGYWADAFAEPRLGEVASWLLSAAPSAILAHFARQIVRAKLRPSGSISRKIWYLLEQALYWIVVLPAVLLLTPVVWLMLVVAVLSFVPIGVVQQVSGAIQRALAAVVGDSYIFTEHPIEAAAIVTRIAKALSWLEGKCIEGKILVVAHSQGAAVSFFTLRRHPGNQRALVTFGSGLRKLLELWQDQERRSDRHLSYKSQGWVALMGFLGIASGLVLWHGSRGFAISAFGIGLSFLLSALHAALMDRASSDIGVWAEILRSEQVDWQDYYADRDPVPNGPHLLIKEGKIEAPLNESEIHNRSSIWSDHTSYWDNPEQFVSAVAFRAAQIAGFPLEELRGGDQERVAQAREARKFQVRLGSWIRRLFWVAAVGLGLRITLTGPCQQQMSAEVSALAGAVPGGWSLPLVGFELLAGSAGLFGVFWLAAVMSGFIGRIWLSMEWKQLLRDDSPMTGPASPGLNLAYLVVTVSILPAVSILLASLRVGTTKPDPATWAEVAGAAIPMALGFVVLFLVLPIQWFAFRARRARTYKEERTQ